MAKNKIENKEKFEDGVLEIELTESQIQELIKGLELLKEGHDHIHFNLDNYNQFLIRENKKGKRRV